MKLLTVGTRVHLVTDDTFDGQEGTIIGVFTENSADPDDYRYRVEFLGPISGNVIDSPFRPSEIMEAREICAACGKPQADHDAYGDLDECHFGKPRPDEWTQDEYNRRTNHGKF